MAQWTIYHNPKCSKSREALEMLRFNDIEPVIIDYLKNPPTEADLKKLVTMLDEPSELVRTKEDDYKANKFDTNSLQEIIRQLAQNPRLIERPVVVKDEKAVVARPIEKLKALL